MSVETMVASDKVIFKTTSFLIIIKFDKNLICNLK